MSKIVAIRIMQCVNPKNKNSGLYIDLVGNSEGFIKISNTHIATQNIQNHKEILLNNSCAPSTIITRFGRQHQFILIVSLNFTRNIFICPIIGTTMSILSIT